eukprot:scaffold9324_cov144-Amphora_coffeaeformis.AAC.1
MPNVLRRVLGCCVRWCIMIDIEAYKPRILSLLSSRDSARSLLSASAAGSFPSIKQPIMVVVVVGADRSGFSA